MVHFEDLRVTFDRMDWCSYSYSYYKLLWTILVMKLSMFFIENHILSSSLESPKACCDTLYSMEGQRPSKYGLIPKVYLIYDDSSKILSRLLIYIIITITKVLQDFSICMTLAKIKVTYFKVK